jgi:hypothetical protein
MKPTLKLALFAGALLAGLAGLVGQRQRHARLQEAVATQAATNRRLAAETVRRQEVAANRAADVAAAQSQVRAEIEQARKAVADLEATPRPVTIAPAPASARREAPFTANRDPEKGPVRLEHFRNVGRATPAAAFQTLIWALSTDEGAAQAALFALSPTGRDKLQAIVARMTPDQQARFNPPEKVLGLLASLDFLDEEGYEIGPAGEPDVSGQVKLVVRRARSGRTNLLDKRLPFQRGADGWQLAIPDKMIDEIPASLAQASMYVPPKRNPPALNAEPNK